MKRHTREDSGIELDEQLRWWHDAQLVEHPRVIEAFNCGLKVTDEGRYRLEIGPDWCWVKVHGAGYGVVAVDESSGALSIRLSDRSAELLDTSTLCLVKDVLFVRVKGKRAWARFSRDSQFQLSPFLEETASGFVLRLGSESAVIQVTDSLSTAIEPREIVVV